MAKTDWQMGDTVLPDDLNQIGQEINQNRDNLAAHTAATTGVHGATSAATPNTLVQRDPNGRFKAAAPSDPDDVARKQEVDTRAVKGPATEAQINDPRNTPSGIYDIDEAVSAAIGLGPQWHYVIHMQHRFWPGGYSAQIAVPFSNGSPKYRQADGTSWSPWVSIARKAEVDQMLPRDGSAPMTGNLFWSDWANISTNTAGRMMISDNAYLHPTAGSMHYRKNHDNLGARGVIIDWSQPPEKQLSVFAKIGVTTVADQEFTLTWGVDRFPIWHDGNDGAGSGLDADTVRGYVPINKNGDTMGGPLISDANGFRTPQADRPLITKGWDPFTSGLYAGLGRWGIFMESGRMGFGLPSGDPRVFYYKEDSTIAAEYRLWHEGNDGAGSGLDADTVRGLFPDINPTPGTVVVRDNVEGGIIAKSFVTVDAPPVGNEGGQINLGKPPSGSSLAAHVAIDVNGDAVRIFEQGGIFRGVHIDLSSISRGIGNVPLWHAENFPYETGIWTPELRFGGSTSGITYSGRWGRYTRIGNIVYWVLQLDLSSKGSATGEAAITGLPFIATNNPPHFATAVGGFTNINLPSGATAINALVPFGTNFIILRASGNVSLLTNLNNSNFTNNSAISAEGMYIINGGV
jgi:hypothetical protein